ncbi:uncharacterized protein Z519_03635 [Cladophialophora bantiana CBS 173.52]|uniref:Uncharacterized protein n=1 Tax=Cladophialophora bantiana (strain ATCC 10958 / CBS 173.52 / CDC B-1940 / NIH 8579) TaxID=1442370 RepID=A0A0D2IE56_CLAB1|nr:uncharacterized protein Z519_03635 [Cladophialophora bantiana CBS 173.52]KIW95054.1 hypothetical protein Z519_03635 [Cladophialophora bantiana CBS 173.52]
MGTVVVNVGEFFFQVMQDTGRMEKSMDVTLFPQQPDGCLEETLWSETLPPILDEQGRVNGFYHRTAEVTNEKGTTSRPKESVWEHFFEALRENPQDVPMAFAYSAEDDAASGKVDFAIVAGLAAGWTFTKDRRVSHSITTD